jgi:DNA-binding transcriptional LysR family regulator
MDQLEAMRVYARVAELASFTRAAQVLGWPKASVSTAVQRLEAQLGTRLLQRSTRRVHLTPDGQLYLERCRELLAELDELQQLFRPQAAGLQGRLRVDMPTGTARAVVVPRLPEFLARHPGLHIELGSTDRRVDLVGEGYDCVLRVGALEDSSLVARPLGRLAQLNCASPAYLEAFGTPRTLEDLQHHRLVHYAIGLGARGAGFEYVDPATGAARSLPMEGCLTVNNAQSYEAACLAGLGLIQAPDVALRPHLEAGRLVEVLPGWRAAPLPVTLLYANRRHVARRLQAFMAWLEEVLRPYLLEAAGA